jgi:hypothetical protein
MATLAAARLSPVRPLNQQPPARLTMEKVTGNLYEIAGSDGNVAFERGRQPRFSV